MYDMSVRPLLRSALLAFPFAALAACAPSPEEEGASQASAIKGKRDAGSLTLHFYPRQDKPIDYTSPASALLSFSKDDRLGHTMVDITCERPSGAKFVLLTGQTGSENDREYLEAGWGFKVLDMPFEGGYLQTEGAVKGRLEELAKKGKSSFFKVLVNGDQCERMAKFYEGYTKAEAQKHFGVQLRPRYFEGGGCTNFGVTFVEVAGLLTDEHRERWRQKLDIPNTLIGDPPNGKKVSLASVFTRFSWARSNEASTRAVFWEPNLVHQWVVDKREAVTKSPVPGLKSATDGIVPGLEFDARDLVAPTEAEDPIFKVPAPVKEEPKPAGPPMQENEGTDVGMDLGDD